MLVDALHEEYSQFIAVYGRRRVGKTFLIIFGHQLAIFHHVGGVGRINGDVLQCRIPYEFENFVSNF